MNRDAHAAVGLIASIGAILWKARSQRRKARLGEIVGAALGGPLGARGPDVLEPADHPNHRAAAHSVLALAAVATGTVKAAEILDAFPVEGTEGAQFVRDLVRGFVVAVPAGYASHLAADATTPKGIPLHGIR